MTYASQTLEKDLQDILLRMAKSPRELLTQDVVCPGEWVLMAALQRTEAGELFKLAQCRNTDATPGEPPWRIGVCPVCADTSVAELESTVIPGITDIQLQQLKESLSYHYPFLSATQAPSKQTATQRKGRLKDDEAAQETVPSRKKYRAFRKPSFAGTNTTAADHGNAVHLAMEHISFDRCGDAYSVDQEIKRLVTEGFLTAQQAAMVDISQIAQFFASDLGKRLIYAKHVLREFKFSILDDAACYDPALQDEKILLQGVIDCALIEDDGITVLDFKTDIVTEDTLQDVAERYRPQVSTYADAISKIYGKPVKQALLYFFRIGKFIEIA